MLLQALLAFVVSLLASAWLVRAGRRVAANYAPDMPQRFHVGDVPRLGGLAVALGLAAAAGRAVFSPLAGDVGAAALPWRDVVMWWAVVLPCVCGAWYEDCTQRLAPRWRLALTLLSAVLAVALLDLAIPRSDLAWFDPLWQAVPVLGVLMAVVAVAGLPHAFNIIDGYNGLASVVALVVALAMAYVALKVGDWVLAGWLVALAGATLGFLLWNYPRGLLFAGDGGAYFWGASLAIAAIQLVQRHETVSPWFPMLLLMYPVWETLFSIYRKVARGESPGVADALHFHQLIYRRLVRGVFHDDHARQLLMRNNRTSPYLWGFTALTVVPAVVFWNLTPVLMGFCGLFAIIYVSGYLTIVRFKVPRWLKR